MMRTGKHASSYGVVGVERSDCEGGMLNSDIQPTHAHTHTP